MLNILEAVLVLGLVVAGLGIMVGLISPGDALKRLGVFLAIILIVPPALTFLFQNMVAPALSAALAMLKPILWIGGAIVVLILIVWAVGAPRRHHSGDQS